VGEPFDPSQRGDNEGKQHDVWRMDARPAPVSDNTFQHSGDAELLGHVDDERDQPREARQCPLVRPRDGDDVRCASRRAWR